MKYFFFALLFSVVTLFACNKDKFQTRPTISIRSVNTTEIPLNGNLVINIDCTDKEGDVADSVILIKQRLNKRVVATIRDTIRYTFPSFPKTQRTIIQATIDYQSVLSAFNPPFITGSNPLRRESDTLRLRFAVRDKAGNTSDTVETPIIHVFRQ